MIGAAFPDMRFAVTHMVQEDDLVMAHGLFEGTHEGEFMGMPATGRRVSVPFADVVRFRDGMGVEHWGVFDGGMMMQQLGQGPAPPSGRAGPRAPGGGGNPPSQTPGAARERRAAALILRRRGRRKGADVRPSARKGAPVPPPRSILERHGRLMARGRWIVIPLFVALLVGAVMLAGRIGDVTTDEQTLPGSEAARGIELVQTRFSDGREATDIQPVFRNPSLTVNDPAYWAEVTAALKRGAGVVPGTRVVSYFTTGSRDLVGQDGHMTFATLSVPLPEQQATKHIDAIRDAIGTPDGFSPTLVGGDAAVWHDLEPQLNDDLARAEMIVLPARAARPADLLRQRRERAAAGPDGRRHDRLRLRGTYLAGQAMDIADLVTNVITLVGIAIGIDYALLVVSRFREEMRTGRRPRGRDRPHDGDRRPRGAASGVTVAIGLAVLVALNVPFIRSMGIGGMLVPVFGRADRLTALPAAAAVLGPR